MNDLDKFTDLSEVTRIFSSSYDSEDVIIQFNSTTDRNTWHNKLSQLEVPCDCEGDKEIAIYIRRMSGFYYDREDFRRRAKTVTFEHFIYVLRDTPVSGLTLAPSVSLQPVKNKNGGWDCFYSNIYYYYRIFQDFKEIGVHSYQDDAHKEFVLLSPNKKEFFLKYPVIAPDFGEVDLSNKHKAIQSIKDAVEKSPELLVFFKEQIINRLIGVEDVDLRFVEFVKNIEQIASFAKTDFEVYLRDFNFEQFKEKFRKERDEYFARLRSILESLLGKIVSVPVPISATALALYNIGDDLLSSSLVVFGAVILSIFTSWLIRGLHEDVLIVESDFKYEEDVLTSSGFHEIDRVIKREINKVDKRISQIKRYLYAIQSFLALSSATALWVYLDRILKYENTPAICVVILLVVYVQFMFCFFMLKNDIVDYAPSKK